MEKCGQKKREKKRMVRTKQWSTSSLAPSYLYHGWTHGISKFDVFYDRRYKPIFIPHESVNDSIHYSLSPFKSRQARNMLKNSSPFKPVLCCAGGGQVSGWDKETQPPPARPGPNRLDPTAWTQPTPWVLILKRETC